MSKPTKSLKVGFVLDDGLDKPDGVQQYILALGKWLSLNGHNVHYLVGETKRTDLPHVHSLSRNVRVRSNGNSLTIPLPTSKSKLKNFLIQEKFDVLHIQVPYSPFMGHKLIVSASPQTAIVGTFHIAPSTKIISAGNTILGYWVRSSLKKFDVMLSVSSTAQKFAKDTFGTGSTILPNVVDYPLFHAAKPLAQYDHDIITILFLGRLVNRKGCLLLLQAVKQLVVRVDLPKFRVLICGRGHLESKLKAFVAENNLSDYVDFVGFVSEADKPRYYASADISVFPSTGGESFGIVLLEAMASGKSAVLAGDNPGYRSVLVDYPEQLFDPQNSLELASKIAFLAANKQQRTRTALAGSVFTKEFDTAKVGSQLLKIYYKALISKSKK